jgi:meso-butanediol dehydrogenase/(S,S)-butanediol dehydrogenase/diacetyl reductase
LRFSGKTVVVTGGASGIGLAAVRRFHAEGAAVVVADINGDAARDVARELGDNRCLARKVDVSNWEQVKDLMDRAAATFGGLDIVFNNAGITSFSAIPESSLEEWHRVIEIDLSGIFFGCKAAIPLMRERGGGAIINTASGSGLKGDYGAIAYCAAKGGVINFTRAAALDHAREGIRVNAVSPGPIATPLLRGIDKMKKLRDQWQESIPMGRFGNPEEIAAVVAFLASDDATYLTGVTIPVDGGVMAHTGSPNVPKFLKENPGDFS